MRLLCLPAPLSQPIKLGYLVLSSLKFQIGPYQPTSRQPFRPNVLLIFSIFYQRFRSKKKFDDRRTESSSYLIRKVCHKIEALKLVCQLWPIDAIRHITNSSPTGHYYTPQFHRGSPEKPLRLRQVAHRQARRDWNWVGRFQVDYFGRMIENHFVLELKALFS